MRPLHDVDYVIASLAADQTKCLNYLKECAVSQTNLDAPLGLLSEFIQHQVILHLVHIEELLNQRKEDGRSAPCVGVLGVARWAGTALVPHFNMWHGCRFSLRRFVNSVQIIQWGCPGQIKFLHRGAGHSCINTKRPIQGLVCSVDELEKEMPASPCALAHRGCSVCDQGDTMMPDTVSPAADPSVQHVYFYRTHRSLGIFMIMRE